MRKGKSDGIRFAFRGIPVVVFKLKTAINVDELIELQNFEFKRTSTRQNKTHVDTIGCKILFMYNLVLWNRFLIYAMHDPACPSSQTTF